MSDKPTFELYEVNGRTYRRATNSYREKYKQDQKLVAHEVRLDNGKTGTVLRKKWTTK